MLHPASYTDTELSPLRPGFPGERRPLDVDIEDLHDGKVTFLLTPGEHDRCYERLAGAESVDRIEEVGESLLVTKASCGAYAAVADNQARFQRSSHISHRRRVYTVRVFQRDQLRDVVAAFDRIGTVTLERLETVGADRTDLTDRQREVVEHALENGYFAWPRESSSDDLAADLGISRATFLEHLRKGERRLLSQALEDI